MARRTLARPAEAAGTGLHTGLPAGVRLLPARAGQGIVFRRVDLDPAVLVPATLTAVAESDRRTALEAGGARVETVEHLLAAVHAAGIDDLTVEVDGPEVPILDGSFQPFVELLDRAGVVGLPGEPMRLSLREPLEIAEGASRYRAEPADALRLETGLEHTQPVIGRQRARWDGTAEAFRQEIAPARTYGFLSEIDALHGRGLVRGGSAASALVLSETEVLNGPLRWPDEFARHKLGDLLGDLALLGARLGVAITAERPSHRGNLACARALARAARLPEG